MHLTPLALALAIGPRAGTASQLTLEWGVYATTMPMSGSVDELIETALRTAKRFAGRPTGALVVITAGRRTGAAGATN